MQSFYTIFWTHVKRTSFFPYQQDSWGVVFYMHYCSNFFKYLLNRKIFVFKKTRPILTPPNIFEWDVWWKSVFEYLVEVFLLLSQSWFFQSAILTGGWNHPISHSLKPQKSSMHAYTLLQMCSKKCSSTYKML